MTFSPKRHGHEPISRSENRSFYEWSLQAEEIRRHEEINGVVNDWIGIEL